ncbi:MAG: hypothetical protein SVG88_11750 [Halobacteriales archaeon]|nr:hypothetical protein [Halobacteriales archaeon]
MAETRLTPEVDLEGVSPEEAFAVLGDETRLDIIRILWRAGALHEYDDLDDTTATLSFSDLRHRADIDDNGRFNYHLSKLTPHFVRQTDEGYRLSEAGKKIARTVIAIAGERDPDVSDEIETDCPVCGSAVTATYEDQWLRFTCTECAGLFGDAAPEGTILNSPFPPTSVADRDSEETLTSGLYRCMLDLSYMMQGVCRECAGNVNGSITVCEDHTTEGGDRCESCGTPFEIWGELRCETCRFAKRLPIELCVVGLAPVIGFLYSHDINVLTPSFDEIIGLLQSQVDTTVSTEPFRVAATIETSADALTVTLNEHMAVVDVAD